MKGQRQQPRNAGLRASLLAAVITLISAPAFAQQATALLTNGERLSGDFSSYDFSTLDIRGRGGDRRPIPVSDVVVLDFSGSDRFNASDAEIAAARRSDNLLVTRAGDIQSGWIVDFVREGGEGAAIVFAGEDGDRHSFPLRDITRVYFGQLDARSASLLRNDAGTDWRRADDRNGNRWGRGAMEVPANGRWVDTGLDVQQGERLDVDASGTVSLRGDGYDAGPEGVADNHRSRTSMLPNVVVGSLIARIDNARPFVVGGQQSVTMPESGRLFLAVNDDQFSDNSGAFHVRLSSQNARGSAAGNRDDAWRYGNARTDRGRARRVSVPAGERWVDTGVDVRRGERVEFNASGTVYLRANGNTEAGPAGARDGVRTRRAPMPDVLAGALIGRVGNGRPFGIGDQTSVTMPDSGRLYLAVNDDAVADNSGAFQVRVAPTESLAYQPR